MAGLFPSVAAALEMKMTLNQEEAAELCGSFPHHIDKAEPSELPRSTLPKGAERIVRVGQCEDRAWWSRRDGSVPGAPTENWTPSCWARMRFGFLATINLHLLPGGLVIIRLHKAETYRQRHT